jgi:hypothetical protein
VRVTPSGVHDEAARVLANGLGESLRAFLDDDITPSLFAGDGRVERWAVRVVAVLEGWDNDLILKARFALDGDLSQTDDIELECTYSLALDRATVDGDITKVRKELLRTVLSLNEPEELRSIVDELQNIVTTVPK